MEKAIYLVLWLSTLLVAHGSQESIAPWNMQSRLGNPFCFADSDMQAYQSCCGGAGAPDCWRGALTYEACCRAGTVSWRAAGTVADVEFSGKVSMHGKRCPGWPACSCDIVLLPFSSRRIKRLTGGQRFSSGNSNRRGCNSMAGEIHNVTVAFRDSADNFSILHFQQFQLCTPSACRPEAVATVLGPNFFFDFYVDHIQEPGIRVLMLFRSRVESFSHASSSERIGYLGHASPPAQADHLATYRNMFQICGRCNLRRYGGAGDGGYLMCSLEDAADQYISAYSYGIDGNDSWGEAVSIAASVVVNQYDCFVGSPPPCEAPCRSRFHGKCLAHYDFSGGPFNNESAYEVGTLASHLESNGHLYADVGQLLLKLDIEGAEWDVLSRVDTLMFFGSSAKSF